MKKLLSILLLLVLLFSVNASPPVGLRIAAPSPAASASTLFLDETGLGSADAAYSVARKLRAAYAGQCLRVRRSSDSTESDIGFSNNQMDAATLTTFCSGTDGFLTTIYDQSSNGRNLTQSTAANQPQIVSSGTIFTGANGKPECRFDGSNDRMTATSWTLVTPVSVFSVLKQITYTIGDYLMDGTTANNLVLIQHTVSPRIATFTPTVFIDNNDLPVNTSAIATLIFDQANSLVQINAGTATTGNLPSSSPGGLSLGSSALGTLFGNLGLQELALYSTSKNSTDRTTARGNMNAFYTLF